MMTSHGKIRREKSSLAEYDSQMKDLRVQLTDQIKILDSQEDLKQQQLNDLNEFVRRRGDIEAEYARALDKLTERFTHKTRKKEPWGQSVWGVWSVLLTQTRLESREHAALGESCWNTLTQRLTHTSEDTHRLHKRSKEVGIQMQEELLKVTSELQMALRTYTQYHTEVVAAEVKLKEAERLEERHTNCGQSQQDRQRRSSMKKMERLMEKRLARVQESQLKCTKARNDYLLNLAAANAAMNKYYLQDVSTLIDCSDLGFHLSVERAMRAYVDSRGRVLRTEEAGLKQLEAAVTSLDQSGDRDALLQQHDTTFCLPFKFNFHPHEGDQVCEVSAENQVRYELETRFQQIQSRMAAVTLGTEEVSKTLKATLAALLESVCDSDCNPAPDVPPSQSHEALGGSSHAKLTLAKRRANQQETEMFYFSKVKEFLTSSSLTFKLQAKHDLLQDAIHKAKAVDSDPSRMHCVHTLRAQRSRPRPQFNHTLFNTDIVSYTQSCGQQIPVVVESCIRFINLHGLHHEGIFRVPGSQREVNLLRDAFERAEDPLSDRDWDLDSVAGVLKLYFRGLEPPLFPYDSFCPLLECVQTEEVTEKCAQIKDIVSTFPKPLVILSRYLFTFLHHVSQYSDENMMQSYNLAVCFGPSLLRTLTSDNPVARQPQINDIIKTMIQQHDIIFPSQSEVPGAAYEKHMTLDQDYCEPITEEELEEQAPIEERELEAVAIFDYMARSSAELSFKQGECLILHSKASCDWWRGEVGGVRGLIPHKYISVEGMERERTGGGEPSGTFTAEDGQMENIARMRVYSDGASIPGRQRGGDGSPAPKAPTSPFTGRCSGSQERRHTLDTVRQTSFTPPDRPLDRPPFCPAGRTAAVEEMMSHQMNSVFKELLSRQPVAPPSSPSSSSSAPPTPAAAVKKAGFGLRGRTLFGPMD